MNIALVYAAIFVSLLVLPILEGLLLLQETLSLCEGRFPG